MNPNRTNDLWCKTCKYHKCRCEWVGELRVPWPIKRVTRDEFEKMYADGRTMGRGEISPDDLIAARAALYEGADAGRSAPQYTNTLTMMDEMTHGKGVVKVSYINGGGVTVERVDPEAMLVDPPPEPQYTRTMTMDDLRRNALESVIEELKERDA